MVYKKIRNTIPSLSSLLLAGVLLAGCQDGEGAGNKAKEPAMGENEEIVKGNNLGPQQGIPVHNDKLLSSAVVAMRDKIIEFAGLNPLMKDHKQYLIVPVEAFNSSDKEFKLIFRQVLQHFASSDSDGLYPSAMKKDREAWGLLASYLDKMEKPFAAANAFNAFVCLYKEMSRVLFLMKDLDSKGAPLEQYDKFRDDHIKPLLLKLNQVDETYVGKQKFPNKCPGTERIMWLEGEKWARFMRDVNNKGEDKGPNKQGKGHAYGMPNLLQKEYSIWIKNYCKDSLDYHKNPYENLDKRGVGISGSWKVGNVNMPEITRLYNDRVVKKFYIEHFVLDENGGYLGIDIADAAMFPILDHSEYQYNSDAAILSDYQDGGNNKKLTFGSLMLLLFNDNGNNHSKESCLDFLTITSHNKGTVSVKMNQSRFEKLLKLCGNDKQFAQALGKHIEDTSLKDRIIVPDYRDLLSKLSLDGSISDEQGGLQIVDAGLKLSKENVPLYVICKNIYEGLLLSVPNMDLIFESLGKIAEIESHDSYNESDVTFEQRVYIGLAKKLFEYKSKWVSGASQEYKTREQLEKIVSSYLEDMLESVLVFKGLSGEYEHTRASRELRGHLMEVRKKLAKKRDNLEIGYNKILHDFLSKQPGPDDTKKSFDIGNMCKSTLEYFQKVSSISRLDIPSALSMDKKIEKSDFKAAGWILPQKYDELNEIKDDYKDKLTKSSTKSGRGI
ncbi:hypothetical protein [Candidatus Cardinium sp. TP]|uniref:hypothetical protein n=1 Tax=Candidatus Cardinium sp. TP TaxID=2961955 RepID=UPI0021AFB4F6|nr:hypothetical protein [Candidatus Cardinium sp. TP]MCT4696964.1 hypothetical protein [Candidatus Cardinium sp. TP]MDN5247488.1 hypothetical protein [Candidatus Cardinium sp.]